MSLINAWSGAVTATGFRVRAKVTGASARLAVSTSPDLTSPTWVGPVTPTAHGMATFDVTGRSADIRYYWAVETDGTLDFTRTGRTRTFPAAGEPASFTFASSACGGHNQGDTTFWPPDSGVTKITNHPVYDAIRARDPLFFLHLGDMHYRDIGVNDPAQFRLAYDDVLSAPRADALFRAVPLVYTWDDHDYGPNNSNSTAPGRAAATTVYREKIPSYPLVDSLAIYHTFVVGRVRFIITDLRTYKDPPTGNDPATRTMLGTTQKQWFKDVLTATTEQVIVWASSSTWTQEPIEGYDGWRSYSYERAELAAHITSLGLNDRMCLLQGDCHAVAVDDGSNNPYGGFPIYQLASLDSGPATFGATFSHGEVPGRGQYGTLEFVDDGERITVTVRTWTMGTMRQAAAFTVGPPPDTIESTIHALNGTGDALTIGAPRVLRGARGLPIASTQIRTS